jgi:hypothetical protein
VPTVQFGITFDKRIEINLDYKNRKLAPKILKLLHHSMYAAYFMYKKVWSMKDIFLKFISQGAFSIYMNRKQTYAKEPRNNNWYPNKCC